MLIIEASSHGVSLVASNLGCPSNSPAVIQVVTMFNQARGRLAYGRQEGKRRG